jgi:polar amino acid transport system ATP-binding protein
MNLLEVPTSGKLYVNGADITAHKPDIMKVRQNIGMVFQHFHLFPHMTVLKNVTYAPLNVKHISHEIRRDKKDWNYWQKLVYQIKPMFTLLSYLEDKSNE